jgi:multiple sugar transport system substrate-binding protein
LIAVTSSSRNAASAFNLLAWLAQAETSLQLARAGNQMLPVRESWADSTSWFGSNVPAEKRIEIAKVLERLLTSGQCLLVPRIPGVDEYMAALDQAVQSVVNGDASPQVALQKAAERWEKITDAHGRDTQRDAYLKHLGIEEP